MSNQPGTSRVHKPKYGSSLIYLTERNQSDQNTFGIQRSIQRVRVTSHSNRVNWGTSKNDSALIDLINSWQVKALTVRPKKKYFSTFVSEKERVYREFDAGHTGKKTHINQTNKRAEGINARLYVWVLKYIVGFAVAFDLGNVAVFGLNSSPPFRNAFDYVLVILSAILWHSIMDVRIFLYQGRILKLWP